MDAAADMLARAPRKKLCVGFDFVSDIAATTPPADRTGAGVSGDFLRKPELSGGWYRVCPWRLGGGRTLRSGDEEGKAA